MVKNITVSVEFDLRKQNLAKPGRENWAADTNVTHCTGCRAEFNLFVRRHHCRACGDIFCDTCTTYRTVLQRSHYAHGVAKQKRVCAECHERYMKHAVSQNGAELEVKEAELEVKELLGLPKLNVTSVDHEGAENGKLFFFDVDELQQVFGERPGNTWLGKTFDVVQFRDGQRIWSGAITVTRAGAACFGKRKEVPEYGQWQVGDLVVHGSNAVNNNWTVENTIKLGSAICMFDETIMRLDSKEHYSVSDTLEKLCSGAVVCDEGICIVYSTSQEQYYLLVREDRRLLGLQLFDDSQEF